MKNLLVFTAVLTCIPQALAHHSDAGIEVEKIIALEGTVTGYHWRNPHVYIHMEVVDEIGETVEWEFQMGPVNVISRRGWTKDSIAPGDRVTVRGHPAAGGRPYAVLQSLEKEGGTHLSTVVSAPETPATALTLDGNWIADRSSLLSYPGGFDGFFHAHLKLTEKGKTAQAAFDPLSGENPESTCVGRPTPAMLVSTGLYLMQIKIDEDSDIIFIRSEWFDEERTVYLDGRGHPPEVERFETGHSIGHWEGDTLVVDTANFSDHRSPYQVGVPSGAQKHVVERYLLNEAGTHIELEFMLEDPEYLAEPMTHSRELIYSPHLELFLGGCDPAATSRFVEK